MICETCMGGGMVLTATGTHILLGGYHPCPDCDGKGTTHCCEGHRPSASDSAPGSAPSCIIDGAPDSQESNNDARGASTPSDHHTCD